MMVMNDWPEYGDSTDEPHTVNNNHHITIIWAPLYSDFRSIGIQVKVDLKKCSGLWELKYSYDCC